MKKRLSIALPRRRVPELRPVPFDSDQETRQRCRALAPSVPASGEPRVVAPQTSTPPLVTCIMPTCDRHRFVPEAVRYFLRQDYPNLELVVVDDGNMPVAPLLPHDPRIRLIRLSDKKNVGAKRNIACAAAHGEFIVHWDDDDWYPARSRDAADRSPAKGSRGNLRDEHPLLLRPGSRAEHGVTAIEIAVDHGWLGTLSPTASHGGVRIDSQKFKWAKIPALSGPRHESRYATSACRISAWRAFIPRTLAVNRHTVRAGTRARSLPSKACLAANGQPSLDRRQFPRRAPPYR